MLMTNVHLVKIPHFNKTEHVTKKMLIFVKKKKKQPKKRY